jgi:hypothetical protein
MLFLKFSMCSLGVFLVAPHFIPYPLPKVLHLYTGTKGYALYTHIQTAILGTCQDWVFFVYTHIQTAILGTYQDWVFFGDRPINKKQKLGGSPSYILKLHGVCSSIRLSVRPGVDLGFRTSTDGQDQVLKSRSLDGRGGRRRRMTAATISSRCDQRSLRAYWWWIVRAVSGHYLGQHGSFFFFFFVLLFGGFVFCVCPSGQFPGTTRANTDLFFFFFGFFFLCQLKSFRA